ncbi:MAG: hypothetical protein R2793_09250 [Flavobacteriaceae bacterium]
MKNAVAIVLLFIFTFNLGGYYYFFKVQQRSLRKEVKRQIKEGIPEEELVLITITPQNKTKVQWKHDEEFEFEGSMYDVVRTEILNENTIVYHALPDEKEHQLIETFLEKIKKDQQKDQKTNSLKYFKIVLRLPPSPMVKEDAVAYEEYPKHRFSYTNLYHSVLLDINSPPPKFV